MSIESVAVTLPPVSSQAGDITSCNNEPVQFIGSIQSHGTVLVFSAPDYRIQAASKNVEDYLGHKHDQVIGARLEHILQTDWFESVVAAVRDYPWNESNGRYLCFENEDQTYDGYLYYIDGLFGLDIEMDPGVHKHPVDRTEIDQKVKEYMQKASSSQGLTDLARDLAVTIRNLTGIDRVMIYRFIAPHAHGEVIAEDRVAKAHSYNSHRFPASDIPKPARDLYLRNQLRMIVNVNEDTIAIEPQLNPLTKKTLDLSDSRLRAVSPIHLEYLRNMKVGSSFSVAIRSEGKLWGLIACHHLEPFYIPAPQRSACEVVANAFAAQSMLLENLNQSDAKNRFDMQLRTLFSRIHSTTSPKEELFRQHRLVTEIFGASGIAYVNPATNEVDFAGVTPPRASIEALAKWAGEKMQKDNKTSLAVHDLPLQRQEFETFRSLACGMLTLKVDEMTGAQFIFFRPEVAQTITWGGDPRKQLDRKNFQGRINPRHSFEAWEEVVQGQSRTWAFYEIDGANFFRELVFESVIRKQSLINELSEKLHPTKKNS